MRVPLELLGTFVPNVAANSEKTRSVYKASDPSVPGAIYTTLSADHLSDSLHVFGIAIRRFSSSDLTNVPVNNAASTTFHQLFPQSPKIYPLFIEGQHGFSRVFRWRQESSDVDADQVRGLVAGNYFYLFPGLFK